jgi:hypothetical protein
MPQIALKAPVPPRATLGVLLRAPTAAAINSTKPPMFLYSPNDAKSLVSRVILPLACALTLSCSDCSFEAASVDAFLNRETSQQCVKDSDCVVETVNCIELESAFCGQITLNKKTAASTEWKELKADAVDCSEDSCAVCLALLVASCSNGSCS